MWKNTINNQKRWIALAVGLLIAAVPFYNLLRGNWPMVNAVQLGPLQIHFYGVVIMLGIFLAMQLARLNINSDSKLKGVDVDSAMIWALVPALLLARAWYVATNWSYYQSHIVEALQIWNGGLAIFGGFIGAIAGLYIYARRNKINLMLGLEYAAVVVPLGHAIGRLGNFFNQELYGPVTNLPWGQYVRLTGQYHHPAFLYEIIGNLIIFAWMYRQSRSQKPSGNGFYLYAYIIGYGVLRFMVDFYRLDPKTDLLGLSVGQIACVMMVLAGMVGLYKINRVKQQDGKR